MHVNNTLTIALWNAQGVSNTSKQAELKLFLSKMNIDIICLQETFLNSHHKLHINNYNIYRTDRPNHGGGVAICIRNHIKHKLLNNLATSCIENISLEIYQRTTSFIITSVYCPSFSQFFEADIPKLAQVNPQTLLFGDLNAHHTSWNCLKNNRAGLAIYNIQQDFPIHVYAPPTATHFPHSGSTRSTIDILVSSSSLDIENIHTSEDIGSDHCAVICDINLSIIHQTRTRLNYRKANWTRYRNIIIEGMKDIVIPHSKPLVDITISQLADLITTARDASIPSITLNPNPNKPATDTINTIREKNCLLRRWRRCTNPHEKERLKSCKSSLMN